jgi:predicted PurR-regulated permease PerM
MDIVLEKFIRGQSIEAFFVGVMSVIFLSELGVNFALIIGIIAGLANMAPYLVGPLVRLVLVLTVGIIQFLDNTFSTAFVGYNLHLGSVAMACRRSNLRKHRIGIYNKVYLSLMSI